MLTNSEKDVIINTISHPAFSFSLSNGMPFYTSIEKEALFERVEKLRDFLDDNFQDYDYIDRVEIFLSKGNDLFPMTFNDNYTLPIPDDATICPDERLSARTAFGLICTEDGANCIGFSELCCILYNLKGYESAPIIVTL